MKTINLAKLIADKGLDKAEIARALFPNNRFPNEALSRIISGVGVLDANQISKLASMCNLPISELFEGGNWTAESKNGVHKFTNGKYVAELDCTTWNTKLYHDGTLYHEDILHSGLTTLSEYLYVLDNLIDENEHRY